MGLDITYDGTHGKSHRYNHIWGKHRTLVEDFSLTYSGYKPNQCQMQLCYGKKLVPNGHYEPSKVT